MRCEEYYEKWKKDPNWCEKCQSAVSRINNYFDLAGELESKGIPKETTFVGLSEGAARPLFTEKNPVVKAKAISHVEKLLKRETPTGGKYKKKITIGEVKIGIKKIRNELNPVSPIPHY